MPSPSDMPLSGRVALDTGAARRGIGAAHAAALAAAGFIREYVLSRVDDSDVVRDLISVVDPANAL